MVAMLAGGHLLVEGVPGLAKTLTVKTFWIQIFWKLKKHHISRLFESGFGGVRVSTLACKGLSAVCLLKKGVFQMWRHFRAGIRFGASPTRWDARERGVLMRAVYESWLNGIATATLFGLGERPSIGCNGHGSSQPKHGCAGAGMGDTAAWRCS